jgi:hypothetical protein
MSIPVPGVCQYCGITEAEIDQSAALGWQDKRRICCTKYSCFKQESAKRRALARKLREQRRKRTPAEVHAEICGRKPKKGRAA